MSFLIKSTKNKDIIVEDFYVFKTNHINVATTNWRCIIKECVSTAISSSVRDAYIGTFRVCVPHNHDPERVDAIKRIKFYKIKLLMQQGFENPRDILNRVLRGADEETIMALGKLETVYRFIRDYRSNLKNPKPYMFPELKFSANLAMTCTGELFYQYGPGKFDNIEVCDDF